MSQIKLLMSENSESSVIKRQFLSAITIPLALSVTMILSYVLEVGMDWDFHKLGVFPRKIENLWSVFTFVFVHASWEHLLNNVLSFFILSSFLFYFYRKLSIKVLLISYVMSGAILWVIGRESCHVGASGLIYALAFFLFFSGLFRNYVPLVAISLVVALVYGNMVWHIFPWEVHDPVSWEGHLAGGLTGLVLSILYRNDDPQKPIVIWDEDDSEIEEVNELE